MPGFKKRRSSDESNNSNAKRLLLAGVFVVLGVGLLVAQLLSGSDDGAFVRADFERHVGREVAGAVNDVSPSPDSRVGVLVLYRDAEGPYRQRLEALKGELEDQDRFAGIYNARSVGTYDDDDYSASVDAALRKLSPDVLVVLSAGGFTHTSVSRRMHRFVERGGRFVFAGHVLRWDSPVVRLIHHGKAVAVAKHAAALGRLAPGSRRLAANEPEAYFEQYYSRVDPAFLRQLARSHREG
jgi:hypothetical protein